jgi:serine/threonine protein kinase
MMDEKYIGNYRVLEKIGAGGSAQVYLAVHRDVPNLKVILKILTDPRLIERFKQEADKLALLDGHPSICRIKHFFKHGDDTVIAMEYIDGIPFDRKVKSDGRLPVNEALKVIIDVLSILEFAHGKGIYHRDIKPSNIMVDKTGQVKIIDFGIAKGESDQSLTMVGTACGTPAYMAPEQFTPTEDTNYALVDVYAAGTTLFYLVTGKLPFEGDNEFALRDAKLFNEPVKPRSLNQGISRELESLVLKSLSKEPKDRFQSISEMRQALAEVHDVDTKAKQSTKDVKAAPREKAGKLSVVRIGGTIIAVLVLAYFVFKFVIPSGEKEPPEPARLYSPANGELLAESNQPSLSWEAGAGEGGTYILEYATDSTFSGSRTIAGLGDGSFTFTSSLENAEYFWRVYSVNESGLRGPASEYFAFTVDVPPLELPQGNLTINVDPSGDIYVGGNLLARGRNRASAELDTGAYAVRVENRRSNEKVYHDTLQVRASRTVSRDYAFTFPTRPADPPIEPLGEVRVGSRPRGASIYIDGELQRQKTNYTFELKPGRHIIRVALTIGDEEHDRADTLMVVADSTHKVIFEFE